MVAGDNHLDIKFLGQLGGFGWAEIAKGAVDNRHQDIRFVRRDSERKYFMIRSVAREIDRWPAPGLHEVAYVREIVRAEWNGKGGANGQVANDVGLVGPGHSYLLRRNTQASQFFHRLGRS